MIEYLLIAPWNSAPRSLADWVALLDRLGQRSAVEPDDPDGAVLLLDPLGAQGYAQMESDGRVSAMHLEFHEAAAEPARSLVEAAAAELGWEVVVSDEDDDVEHD
jgi:hypothetical protein